MSAPDTFTIVINNWEKFNPRSDRKSHSWFRLDNNIGAEPKFHGLNAGQKFVTICIFAEVSKNQGRPTTIYVQWLVDMVKMKREDILKTIQILEKTGVAAVSSGNQLVSGGRQSVTKCHTTYERTNVRTNVTDVTNERTNETDERTTAGAQKNKKRETSASALPTRVAVANPRGCISEFLDDPILETLLTTVSVKVQTAWISTYGETDWIKQEIKKANAWMAANPKRVSKDFGRFMTNWLNKGWENYRKGIPSRRMTTSELNMHAIGELWQKIQAE